MNNLIEITPNCYIIRTQAGFNKLLKKLGIIGEYNNGYKYSIYQVTEEPNAIEYIKECQDYDENGNELYNEDGTVKTFKINIYKQYPIKYPCILTFQDETFEHELYKMYIKYVSDDIKIKDFN